MTWQNLSDRMLRTCLKTFSDADDVAPILYKRGAATVSLSKAVWDANYLAIDPNTGASITSTNPMIGVALADLPEGKSLGGDTVERKGIVYRVINTQPDSEGHAKLILQKL